jgi:putative DNA primase/helicase
MPETAGVVSGVYVPAPVQSNKYTKPVDIKKTPNDIAEYIKSRVAIKSLEGNLYVFNPAASVYERYDNNSMGILIDALAKEEIVKIGNSGAYREVINYLKYDHTIAIKEEKALPNNVWAFNDCFVDIHTGMTAPNDGRYFITSTLQCNYNRNAFCPIFDDFIFSVTGGETNLIELIWEIIGYTLSSVMNAKSFFTFVGPKDTGKSLLINVIKSFFLPDCVSGLGISDLGVKFALEDLRNKRLNICADLTDESIPQRAVGAIKILTGLDLARTERKFNSSKTFYCTSKLIFSANYCVKVDKPDEAFSERQVTVPFLYPIPKERQDKQLLSRLRTELPGIAVKAMEGYMNLVANNYAFPVVTGRHLLEGMVYDDEKIFRDFYRSFL